MRVCIGASAALAMPRRHRAYSALGAPAGVIAGVASTHDAIFAVDVTAGCSAAPCAAPPTRLSLALSFLSIETINKGRMSAHDALSLASIVAVVDRHRSIVSGAEQGLTGAC